LPQSPNRFGEYGDDHVRFALIENQDRIRQAVRGIRGMFTVPAEQHLCGEGACSRWTAQQAQILQSRSV